MNNFMSVPVYNKDNETYSLNVCNEHIQSNDLLSLYENAITILEERKFEIDDLIIITKKLANDIKLDIQFSRMCETDQIQIIATKLVLDLYTAKKLLYICNKKTMAEVKRMYRYLDVECTVDNLNVAYDIVKYKEKLE